MIFKVASPTKDNEREINELLPSNLLSEIDIDKDNESSSSSLSMTENEIVNVIYYLNYILKNIAYSLNKGQLILDSPALMPFSDMTKFFPVNQFYQTHYEENPVNLQFNKNTKLNYGNLSYHSNANASGYSIFQSNPNRNNFGLNEMNINIDTKRSYHEKFIQCKMKLQEQCGINMNFNSQFKRFDYDNIKHHYQNQNDINSLYKILLSSIKTPLNYLCSQRGSKEMQKYLKKLPSEFITILIDCLDTSISLVMMDIHGNYFIQEMIKSCTPNQITKIVNNIKPNYVKISENSSGTHVLQVMLDYVNNDIVQEYIILTAIANKEIEMALNSNATHVLQKILLTIPEERRVDVNNNILPYIANLCFDANGICLVKKMISTTKSIENKNKIISSIAYNCLAISQNSYGNYAIQFLFKEWGIEKIPSIANVIINNITLLSIQKFSSNVTEMLIENINESQKDLVFEKLFDGKYIMEVLRNKYGRFVFLKALKLMQKEKKDELKISLSKIVLKNAKEKNRLNSFLACF